ncbi:ribonuclease H-like domain-containing protein [Clostridiisalibacter paucivorans]|uniref:ribonuclease H-like domain-containing protein n=1 Tax=Clostridiisalibacter paucivorans TaxID=408753 RepID=UPI0006849255|nr:ribonuclease H-like domain-containing protein [Clostridiisalibacter paucivorans]
MEYITKTYMDKLYIPAKLKQEFLNKKVCFFDIETTGFNRNKNYITIIGIVYYKNSKKIIKQYFADTLNDEYLLLEKFLCDFTNFDTYISYNGDLFDIPFINARLKKYNFNYTISKHKSIDIINIVKKYRDILGLEKYRQKDIEKMLNINRSDKISGKDMVKLYFNYLETQNRETKDIILKHNLDDIYYLPEILKIYDLINDKLRFEIILNNKSNINFNIKQIDVIDNSLFIVGTSSIINIPKQIYFCGNTNLEWNTKEGNFKFNMLLQEGNLSTGQKCFFINKNSFDFTIELLDNSKYNVPENIIIIKDKKNYFIENIKKIIHETIVNIM